MKALRNALQGYGWSPPESKRSHYDLQLGRRVLSLKRFSGSTRDLHAALLQLALVLDEHSEIERAYLVASLPRMTRKRATREWDQVLRVLRPSVAQRLAFVVVGEDPFVLPALLRDDAETLALTSLAHGLERPASMVQSATGHPLSEKFFDVWKVLFGAWLAHEGPVQVRDLGKRAGCSYPTVAKVLRVLEEHGELERDQSRSVRLSAWPRRMLREIYVLRETLRQPMNFRDSSGRRPDMEFLLRRLEKLSPPRVALGGVVAARHYDPTFDLNGLPRLDVMQHGPLSLDWVSQVDPALTPIFTKMETPVLVVHPVKKPKPNFVESAEHTLPVADAVETLLDLYEMGLSEQADELIARLRTRGEAR